MKIGVYVGSFNPVHIGHIKIVNEILDKYLDKVIIVPTGNYWDKKDLIDIKHRINMLKLFENKQIIIDSKNNNYEYTYQILNNLKKEYNNDKLYLIIGADLIPKFHLWKNIDELLKYNILIINRDNIDINKYIKEFKSNNFIIANNIEQIDISSTLIRNDLSVRKKYLDKKVLKYINDNNLYR